MILIKNARVYTMTRQGIIENGEVLVEKGKILEVGEQLGAPKDVKIIDAMGKLLVPGLIDGHCHVGMWEEAIGAPGVDGNEMTDPVTPQLRAIDAINPMDLAFEDARQAGVTTIATGPGSANVVGGTFLAMKTAGERVDDMVVKDPIAMKVAFGENPKRIYGGMKKAPSTRMATAAILRQTLYDAKSYMEKRERAESEKEKPEFNLAKEALIPVLKGEIPLKAHAHRADDIYTAIRIAREFDVKMTLDHCTDGHLIAERLKAENYPAFVGPTFGNRSKVETKNKDFVTPKVLTESGVKVAIITDAPVIPIEHLVICAGLAVNAGLDYMEGWKAITINPAEMLGIADRVGSIEKGKDADFVLFDGDPLMDLNANVLWTMIDGELVYENR